MFSKVLLVLACVAVAMGEMLDVQVCESGPKMEIPEKNCTSVSLSNNVSMHIEMHVTGGAASNGSLTGLYDIFSDDECNTMVNESVAISCSCEESEELKFVCEASALAYPMVTVLVAALMAAML